jgi:GMP synthase (glutamine-hydrolysing)
LAPWRTVSLQFTALHWHGDVFALPAGAVPLASSELTRHQGFLYGRSAWGILFHLEATAATLAGMVDSFADELGHAGIEGRRILAESERRLPELSAIAREVFGAWAGLL